MSLIKTDRNKLSKTLEQAINELREALAEGKIVKYRNEYYKFYEGIKGYGKGKGTFSICATSEYGSDGVIVTRIALAEPNSYDPKRFKETPEAKMVEEMCAKAGMRIHYYGIDSDDQRGKASLCWLITAMWGR